MHLHIACFAIAGGCRRRGAMQLGQTRQLANHFSKCLAQQQAQEVRCSEQSVQVSTYQFSQSPEWCTYLPVLGRRDLPPCAHQQKTREHTVIS